MGIKDRKEREKEHLRASILQAALELYLKDGYEKCSIRSIAAAIEYSPAAIYLHFESKEALFEALFYQVFEAFAQKLMLTREEKHPVRRLYFLGLRYLEFALENPGAYELMFIQKHPNLKLSSSNEAQASIPPNPNCEKPADSIENQGFMQLVTSVYEMKAMGIPLTAEPEVIIMQSWSMAHGIACLYLHGFLQMLPGESKEPHFKKAILNTLYASIVGFNPADYQLDFS